MKGGMTDITDVFAPAMGNFRDIAETALRIREQQYGEQYRPGVIDAAVDACCEAENVVGVVNAIQRVFRAYEMQQ